jgi:hypothetical protein
MEQPETENNKEGLTNKIINDTWGNCLKHWHVTGKTAEMTNNQPTNNATSEQGDERRVEQPMQPTSSENEQNRMRALSSNPSLALKAYQ